MILKLFFAIVFTNIFGVIYDYLQGVRSGVKRKFYLYSTSKILVMVFLRNIIISLRILTFKKRFVLDSLTTIVFITTVYFLIDFKAEETKFELLYLFISSFIFWAFTYAYIGVTSAIFYFFGKVIELSDRETRLISGEANFADRFTLFFQNLFTSILSPNIYILASITTAFTYLTGNLIE